MAPCSKNGLASMELVDGSEGSGFEVVMPAKVLG